MTNPVADISFENAGHADSTYAYLPADTKRSSRIPRVIPFRSSWPGRQEVRESPGPQEVRDSAVVSPSQPASEFPAGSHRATRALNLAVGALALVLAMPLFVLIAVAIKLSSKGPVFYKQVRIGIDRRWNKKQSSYDIRSTDLGGRPFTMYKFRTMIPEAETDGQEIWATPRDPRVTKLGRFLRTTRLDELPQIINVLAGDMNVVGPRPERPGIFAELRDSIPHYHLRQRVMPGITGWAQVNQAYDTCLDDVKQKVNYDLDYLRRRSVRLDLAIMARTVPIMTFSNFGW
jgi:lipopolysaccharide/colanic/teichoic acid biosynthesis glycosyltransferase